MSDSPDTNLQLKKKARRRLLGAIAFAGFAAVVLPMIMDEEPKQQMQDVQIRIPGQEQTPFEPKLPPLAEPDSSAAAGEEQVKEVPATTVVVPSEGAKPAEKAVEKKPEKNSEKPEKVSEKPEKSVEKPVEKPTKARDDEQQRAAAILAGKTFDAPAAKNAGDANNGNEQFVILIGAFSDPANVNQLRAKIGELGVKVYTEALDSPGGKTTRVRAGPFASREAADKALARLKKIGVDGVISARQ